MACEKEVHEMWLSAVTFCSSDAMASSVIYDSTDAQKNEIYLFYIIIKLVKINNTQLTTNDVIKCGKTIVMGKKLFILIYI